MTHNTQDRDALTTLDTRVLIEEATRMLSGLINPTPTEHMAQALLQRLIELRDTGQYYHEEDL